ncbi:MAG: hypothetical protein ABFC97_07490 [Anaerolineaceae bacterium]|nr:hypothetical protein [Anaerolineaceae bacterium]
MNAIFRIVLLCNAHFLLNKTSESGSARLVNPVITASPSCYRASHSSSRI